jgi:hypothetical protein
VFPSRLDLAQEGGDVDALVAGCEGAEPPGCLLELALAAGAVVAPGLVPGDDHVDEPLEEVLLGGVGGAPRVLERLVRGEVLPIAGQVEPALEVRRRP